MSLTLVFKNKSTDEAAAACWNNEVFPVWPPSTRYLDSRSQQDPALATPFSIGHTTITTRSYSPSGMCNQYTIYWGGVSVK